VGNLPLHPLIVHLPLVLAVLLPPLIALILWSEWRRHATTSLWRVALLGGALLSATAFLSVRTGEGEKERVETVVPEAAMERHEERAEVFQWATLVPLAVLIGVAVTKRQSWRRYAGMGALLASLLTAGLAIGVGESGGRLVYQHNAASAYGSTDARGIARSHNDEEVDH